SLETASRERIPKGFRPKAQGCEERATLGARLGHVFNPERVVASGFPPFDAIAAEATTLSGLNMFSRGLSPRVARSSQPWAGGHNPFVIEDACKVQCPLPLSHERCGVSDTLNRNRSLMSALGCDRESCADSNRRPRRP